MKLTLLGTGTSFGIPQLGCGCAVCRSTDPRDKRSRVGALVESDTGTRLLIDTPPELRLQLIAAGIDRLDAVVYTHGHADHTNGIDDLRAITNRLHGALPIYGPADTIHDLQTRFRYIFDDAIQALPGTSKPQGEPHIVEPGHTFHVGDLDITPAQVPHGNVTVFAYRVGPLAYVTDAKSVPQTAIDVFAGVKVLVINALFRRAHPTHLSIAEAVEVARAVGAERTYLTHLTHENSHAALEAELPEGVYPAYDGLTIRID